MSVYCKTYANKTMFNDSTECHCYNNNNSVFLLILVSYFRLSDSQSVERTGMAMLDVQILSGFMLRQSGVETDDLVKRVELLPGRAVLYLDSVSGHRKSLRSKYL